jgi:hypothetical protein
MFRGLVANGSPRLIGLLAAGATLILLGVVIIFFTIATPASVYSMLGFAQISYGMWNLFLLNRATWPVSKQ